MQMTGYTYIWEFQVKPNHQAEFERQYGPEGAWVKLFRQASGFVESLLLQDRSNPLRYVTIDRWKSVESYNAFRSQFSKHYDAIDKTCQALTTKESKLGEFNAKVA